MVYISFLISHVPPAHSFFQKKSVLINLTQNLVQLIFFTLTKQIQKERRLIHEEPAFNIKS